MTNNSIIFVTPRPTLTVLNDHIGKLDIAETAAQTRVVGAAADRDLKYNDVLDDMHTLLGYVQELADNSANPEEAIAIISASGFELKVNGVRTNPLLQARNMGISGMVKLVAKSQGKRATYFWRKSADGGVTWTELAPTLVAKAFVAGLTPASEVSFQVRALTKDGMTNWSYTVTLIVT